MKRLYALWLQAVHLLKKRRRLALTVCSAYVLLGFSLNLNAQTSNVQINGKVTDENNIGMPGVSIKISGTEIGVSTNSDGQYSISAPQNSTLVFSFIGYNKSQAKVGGKTQTINIKLVPANSQLNEVVVVGYGTQRKSDVTGSVSSIKGEALREVPTANVIQALQGRVAGLDINRTGSTPGSGGQIRIRGNRSLSGSNDPLIVLDGIPYGGSINDLNTDDIANIDVLKDASATAIYGSRGSNGVLIITTKKGKIGKPQIAYNAYYGLTKALGKYDLMNGEEFQAFRATAGYSQSPGYSAMELEGIKNGTSTDWQDVALKNGGVTNHELNLSGGTEDIKYGIGSGYFNEKGILTGQSFERYSLRSTIDANIGKRIKISLNSLNNVGYTNGEGINPMYAISRITPLAPVYNADGSPNLYPQTGTVDATETMNPLTLENRNNILDRRRRLRTFNTLTGQYKIIEGLNYRINLGLDFRQDNRGTYTGPNTIVRPNVTTTAGARASVANGESYTYTIDNLITYDKVFAQKHKVTFTGLFGVQRDRGFNTLLNGSDFPAEAIQYYNFSLAKVIDVPANGNNFSRNGLVSYMGRLNYVFNDRYLLTATFRRDGSSVFPQDKYLNYPAFALGWNISNEGFMKNIEAISSLKLRAGYGVTGNQGIPANATRGSLASNRYNYGETNVFGYFVGSLPNKDLKWENTKQYNLGLDFGFFDNRISGSLELYKQQTDNLLVLKSLPTSNGANSYWTNAANTKGKGIEFNLSTVNIRSDKGFEWTSDFNFSINKEEIVQLADKSTLNDIGNGWFVGQPITVIYDYTKTGIWQIEDAAEAAKYNRTPGEIRLKDLNSDGLINDADRSVIGNFQPDWIGGTTQRIAYKGFDLSTVIFARMGGKLVAPYLTTDGTGTGYFAFNSGRVNQYNIDYWTPTNPSNAFPKPVNGATNIPNSSTLGYYDASFIKMRSINLGYTIPAKLIQKTGLNSVKVYVTAANPFILYSPFVKSGLGFDPEGTGTGGAIGGVTGRAVTVGLTTPSTRQFMFGVNARF